MSQTPAAAGQNLPNTIIVNPNTRELQQLSDYDPVEGPAELAWKYGLPYAAPASPLRRIWESIYAPPLKYVFELEAVAPVGPDETHPFERSGGLPPTATRWEASENWSGAYVVPENDLIFVEIAATWTVPAISATEPPGQAASIWVGLDGQRLYDLHSLPQIGTTLQVRSNGDKVYRCFWQWFIDNDPTALPQWIPINLNPGDSVFCAVRAIALTKALVSIVIFGTPNVLWSKIINAPSAPGVPVFDIAGATAQWIVERPRRINSTAFRQLLNFGTVDFTQCVATSAHGPNAVRESYHYPDISRRLHMYERRNNPPPRIVALSKPNLPGTGAFDALTVNYVGP